MKDFLLPHYYKIIGGIMLLIGIVLAILYLKFDINFTIPVFALVSIFLETKYFVLTKTNSMDEIIMILLLLGLVLLVFSKEKYEKEFFTVLREKALAKACIVNSFFTLFSIIFIYGGGFIGVLIFNLYSVFIFYILFFYLSLKKSRL